MMNIWSSLLRRQKHWFTSRPINYLNHRTVFIGREDRYKGIHIDLDDNRNSSQCKTVACFQDALKGSLDQWIHSNNSAAWLTIPIAFSYCIPVAAQKGFKFHHAEDDYSVLCKWLIDDIESRLPRFATHQVGVAGCVLNEKTQEVLMIKDKNRPYAHWTFPGGLADLGENISETAVREVFEETGIKTEFRGILTVREQHAQPAAFGRSDLYFVCLMRPLDFDLHPSDVEVSACAWRPLDVVLNESVQPGITRRVAQLARLTQDNPSLFFTKETLQSIYKKLWYTLYHTELKEMKSNEYKSHYIEAQN